MSRTFAQVPLGLWRDPRFTALSDDGQLALLYLWSGPHSSSAGISVVFDGYASLDRKWENDRWQVARQELEDAGFIARDPTTETVMVIDYFKANKPSSLRHIAAVKNQIANVQCEELQTLAQKALDSALSGSTMAASGPSPKLLALVNGKQ